MTYEEAKRRIDKGDKEAALAWLEEVGSWPMSDPDCRALQVKATRMIIGRRRR